MFIHACLVSMDNLALFQYSKVIFFCDKERAIVICRNKLRNIMDSAYSNYKL